jgi:hypothetical protein
VASGLGGPARARDTPSPRPSSLSAASYHDPCLRSLQSAVYVRRRKDVRLCCRRADLVQLALLEPRGDTAQLSHSEPEETRGLGSVRNISPSELSHFDDARLIFLDTTMGR